MNRKEFLINSSNVDTLLGIYRNEDTYVSQIAANLDMSASNMYDKIGVMEDMDLVQKMPETDGKKPLRLTDEGKEFAREFERLMRVFREVEEQ